jgi:thiamine kinase-like enzyme
MQWPEIGRLCAAVVPGAGNVDISAVGAGLFSETYRVARDGIAYTLKVAATHRPDLRVDLPWEVRVLEHAGSAGLAPRVVYFDLERAVLLTRWVQGRAWISQEARTAENLQRIAELLRRVHALAVPLPVRLVSPLQWIEIYAEALSQRKAHAADPALRRAALVRTQALVELPPAMGVVCHSDLHAMNLLQEGEALVLLDWEYAHVTDPLWDLAGWCANNDLEADLQWRLLSGYLGREPISREWQRLKLLLALYDYVCLLWSQLYLSVRGEAAAPVAERARLLDARLRVPAHYAA